MADWREFFRGKKITVMGLGLLGRGVGDVKFLAECGANLIVTDLKSEKELAPSLVKLRSHKLKAVSYVLGRHRLQDFRGRDFILKAASVPLDSPHIAAARKHGISVEMSTALFAKLAAGVTIVGVTGTRGKSTVTHLLYYILNLWISDIHKNSKIWLGGNVPRVSTLALLKKIKPGDWAVLELDSWQLQGFGEEKISPHIAVFTNFLPDHLNYYGGSLRRYWEDKTNIFKYQKKGDCLIIGPQLKAKSVKFKITAKNSKLVVASPKIVPRGWKIKLVGEHNRQNIALAIKVAEILGVDQAVIKKAVESFRGLPGRLELVREVRGIKIYNDTTATTPDATIAALRTLGDAQCKNIILIAGGADKNLGLTGLVQAIPQCCQAVVLLPGSGSEKFKIQNSKVKRKIQKLKEVKSLKEAVREAMSEAKCGDTVLFSPGFASFGLFKNEYDRGDQFSRLVKKLK